MQVSYIVVKRWNLSLFTWATSSAANIRALLFRLVIQQAEPSILDWLRCMMLNLRFVHASWRRAASAFISKHGNLQSKTQCIFSCRYNDNTDIELIVDVLRKAARSLWEGLLYLLSENYKISGRSHLHTLMLSTTKMYIGPRGSIRRRESKLHRCSLQAIAINWYRIYSLRLPCDHLSSHVYKWLNSSKSKRECSSELFTIALLGNVVFFHSLRKP